MKPIDVYNTLSNATNMWNYTLSGRKYGEWQLEDVLECLDDDGNPREWKIDKKKNSEYNDNVKKEQKKESNDSMFDASNMMNKYFGKIQNGMVRLSMNGDMAIKTSNGYKTYDVKTGTLTNCDSFVFDIGSEFFFIIPTNKVETGDVILASGKPHCVIKAENNRIEALRYEDGSIVTIIPEHHVFMGKTYFYGKIVSMFGKIKGGKGMNGMMKYMMMSEMMKGNGGNNNSMSSMLPMMMFMNGGMGDMFEGMFDFDEEEDEKEEK
jgi:hypothetical protein